MPKIKLRLPNLLARQVEREPGMHEITRRIKHAAESILENEGLTADLDDEAANVLLNWGVARAENVAGRTDGLSDSEAEEVIAPRLRAARRLMRRVNSLIAKRTEMAADEAVQLLDQIIEQAAIIYGDNFVPPDADQRAAFLARQRELTDNPARLVTELINLLENPTNTITANKEENDDQEVGVQELHSQQIDTQEVGIQGN